MDDITSQNLTELIKNIKNKKEIFFILSTARNRSSWFSNVFTYKDSFCYKEQLRYMTNWNEFTDKIEKRPEKYVGFSDPELLHFIETLYKRFPKAKYVLLERDRHDAELSLSHVVSHLKWMTPDIIKRKFDRWDQDIKKFKEIVKHYEHIHFTDMYSIQHIQRIWNYILPDCKFDIDRWELLTSLRVSVTFGDVPFIINHDTCMAPYFNFEKLELAK